MTPDSCFMFWWCFDSLPLNTSVICCYFDLVALNTSCSLDAFMYWCLYVQMNGFMWLWLYDCLKYYKVWGWFFGRKIFFLVGLYPIYKGGFVEIFVKFSNFSVPHFFFFVFFTMTKWGKYSSTQIQVFQKFNNAKTSNVVKLL